MIEITEVEEENVIVNLFIVFFSKIYPLKNNKFNRNNR